MQDSYNQIRFITANYSRLQGLRAIPFGILSVFVSVWSIYNHGPTARLSQPILVAILAALLYWFMDRYYNQVFGQVKQTPRQRKQEIILSISCGALALLAFMLDTTEILPISTLGLVLATSLLEYFWRVNKSEWKKIPRLFPENIVGAGLIVVLSLLPWFGISWWIILGIKSQIVGIFMVFGILIIVTGVWGHIRLLRILPAREAKSDANTL